MKHYLSPDNQIFAYDLDGSQDHLIPEDYILLSEENAIELIKNKQEEYISSQLISNVSPMEKLKRSGLTPEEIKEILGLI